MGDEEMHKQFRIVPILLVVGLNLMFATGVSGQEKLKASGSKTDVSELVGDTSIIAESQVLADEASRLAAEINSKDRADRTKYIAEIRTIRVKITKKTPILRTLLDNMRRTKDSLGISAFDKLSPPVDVPNEAAEKASAEEQSTIQRDIDMVKIDLADKKKVAPASVEIEKLEAHLEFLNRKLQSHVDAQKRADKRAEEAAKYVDDLNTRRAAVYEERGRQAKAMDATIIEGDTAARNLDEALNILDDLSGSLLQADAEGAAYTDRATLVFAVLVGGVIIGFFFIAFTSNEVKTAIFAGDSGIQFVTMFSLVIAIILFGVLKILEGRELAALLGGLSGYILGRGSQRDQAGRENPPPIQSGAPPVAPVAAEPAPVAPAAPAAPAVPPVQSDKPPADAEAAAAQEKPSA